MEKVEMTRGLRFTGERFVPGINDAKLEIEHMQRYYCVLETVKDKTVLDAACGEGYGSNLLSYSAKQVYGIDINADVIDNAKEKYKGRENLIFKEGSIGALPIDDHSIDVVISFETIEHVGEDLQRSFLSEIKRVLKLDGYLIISTPNKAIYSDLFSYNNEFHVKEFYENEFIDFLHDKFNYIELYSQFFEVASIIDNKNTLEKKVCFKGNGVHNGKYYIAIASNKKLPNINLKHVFVNTEEEYIPNIQRILQLQDEVEERNVHLKKLDLEIEADKNIITEHQNHVAKLLEKENDTLNTIISLQQSNYELENKLLQMSGIIDEKESSIEEQQNLIDKIQQKLCEQENNITELRQELLNKEGHIKQLLEAEREYEREKTSRTYRLALKFRKLSLWLLPVNSRRRFLLGLLRKIVKNPKLMLRVINLRRIKNFFEIYKKEGMQGVKYHYQLIEEVENSRLNPFDANRYEVTEVMESRNKQIHEYNKLVFIKHNKPKVSIIIPVYNQFEYTYNCLQSILKNSGDIPYEIIIADDCSTDLTKDLSKVAKGIQVIHNKQNLRFLLNCNNAAQYARGEYIVFLNNDTQVQENWLKPLVEILEKNETVGMTGSKLVYSDGWLQEAGGIFWNDASAWNYGNRKNPDDPEFNYVKEVDYISGAAIMIRASLWKEIGGFDERFAPAYYEDSDLAFEVRKHGYKVVYQPLSVVIHFEGVSNGKDITSGQKAYQVTNQKKFYEKWKDVLEREHFPNAENVFLAKDRSRFKKHILVVDHYVPHYDRDAGGKCTYMYLMLLEKMGFKVTFIGDNFFKHEPYTTDLNQHGIEVLYGNYYYNNWQEWLKENLHYFDYVYLQRPHISIKYIDIVKQYGRAKILYFAHDLHHIREYREYILTGNPEKLDSSNKWKKIEYELFEKADVGHVVGSYEQEIMQKAFPDKPIRNIPLYIYDEIQNDINKNFSKRKDIMYVGGFGHEPNIDAVLWFAKEVFPKVREKYPEMKWHVVGSKVTKEIEALASDNIIIEGFMSDEDLHALYKSCRMAIVPLRVGAGVKGKVVESAYFQIPLITTSIGAEGLDETIGNMIIEDDAEKMAVKVCDLYEDYDKLKMMSDAGEIFIKKYFTEQTARDVLLCDMKG